jgi:hypothetical protein
VSGFKLDDEELGDFMAGLDQMTIAEEAGAISDSLRHQT